MVIGLFLSLIIGALFTILVSFTLEKLRKKCLWHFIFNLSIAGLLSFSPSFIEYDGLYGLYYMAAAFSSVFYAFIATLLHTVKHFSIGNLAISALLFVFLLSSCIAKFVFDKSFYESTYLILLSPISVGMIVDLFYGRIMTDS